MTFIADQRGVLGYIVTYGPGPDEGVVEAFTTAGDLLGSFTSRSRAAAEIASQVGVRSNEDH